MVKLNELALFSGAGGGILGGKLLGWRTVCAVEIDAYCASVLVARQNDGMLDPFPIWDDVRTFDGRPWREIVDVVSGGFPCQDISCAGKGKGITGERSGLWTEFARIIGDVRPRYAFVENSPILTIRGLSNVLGDLAEMGYDARWGVFCGTSVGCPSKGERIFITASHRQHSETRLGNLPNWSQTVFRRCSEKRVSCQWWKSYPNCCDGRVDSRMANRMDRLTALGNGQVPRLAKLAWEMLNEDLLTG
jgi:DNA (cytosine-5)-methyltransferase 1